MKEHFRHSKKITRGRRWHVLRMATLERDGWACVDCGSQRRLECDHVLPVRTHPHLAHDPKNLAIRCASCHTKKTRIECGIKPLPKPRQDWRDSVNSLMREGKQPNEHKENNHA